MAIQGTIKFVNPAKQSEKTGKWSQSIKVATPNNGEVYIYGPSGSFDTYQPNTLVMIEQDGQYWRLAKDQSGVSVTAPGAPMSTTPATVTGGSGYEGQGIDLDAMKAHALKTAGIYIAVANAIRESSLFASDDTIHAATSTVLISTERTYRP